MFAQEIKILKMLKNYYIEIGVVSEDSRRDKQISLGLTNAELMQIHENGSPTRNIPSRPVLDMTIKYAREKLMQKTIDKIIDGVLSENWKISDIEKELNKLCVRMQNYAQSIIYDNNGQLKPNSPKVAAKKKGNHPLFNTGQLARSITCQLVKKS